MFLSSDFANVMNKLNLKMGRESDFEMSCTGNIPQKIDDVCYNYSIMNKLLS